MNKFFILIPIFCALLCSCEKSAPGAAAAVPADVVAELQANAQKHFPANKKLAENWVEKQTRAYVKMSEYLPPIPAAEYAKILKYAKEMSGADYVAMLSNAEDMVVAYESFASRLDGIPDADKAFVMSLFDDSNNIEYKSALSKANEWLGVFSDMNYIKRKFDPADFEALRQSLMQKYKRAPHQVMPEFYAAERALAKIRTFYRRDADPEKLAALKKKLAQDYPQDFARQLDELERYPLAKLLADAPDAQLSPKQKSYRETAEQIFRECVFTRRGEGDRVDVAVLVKMKGRTAIICPKEFMPSKLPVHFGNSLGHIKCSTAYVSEKYPLIILFPDSEPQMFRPIEVVDAKDAASLADRELYMIAPDRGGFTGRSVKVFSEDLDFLNFAESDTPKTQREIKMQRLDRDADKIAINIIDSYQVGENAIIFDPQSRKLVSIALRYYSYGMIDMGGKTGNILGHEKMPIPDFVTFVRQFDGNVSRTAYAPPSSVRFVRMTGLDDWRKLDVSAFWKQKNFIRKYTDINNEYMKFFRHNNYGDALRSFRISSIAIKYKKDFENRNLSKDSFKTRYEAFVIEVLQSMRTDMYRYGGATISGNSFYSIYRGEIAYQIALREAMYNYMKEYLKENTITGFIENGLNIRSDAAGTINDTSRGRYGKGMNIAPSGSTLRTGR